MHQDYIKTIFTTETTSDNSLQYGYPHGKICITIKLDKSCSFEMVQHIRGAARMSDGTIINVDLYKLNQEIKHVE
jgi:hypothetical protein